MWVGKLPEKRSSVTAVAFAPDGRTVYTGDTHGWVLAWDLATRASRALYRRAEPTTGNRGVYSLWPTPDGAALLVSDDQTLRDVFRRDSAPLLTAPEESWGWWRYLLPDGKRVISVEPEWRIGLWDLTTGRRLSVPGSLGEATHITHHDLLPDGVTLLTYQANNYELALWDFRTGEPVGELAPSESGINPCALAKDGNTFAVGRGMKLWLYDVPGRSLRHRLKFERSLRELAFHPNGRLLASAATNSEITLWDAFVGERVTQFDWKAGKVRALCFAPDGLTCAAGGTESLVVFDVDA